MVVCAENGRIAVYPKRHIALKEELAREERAARQEHRAACVCRIVDSLLNNSRFKRHAVAHCVIGRFRNVENGCVRYHTAREIHVIVNANTHKSKTFGFCRVNSVANLRYGVHKAEALRAVSAVYHKVICALLRVYGNLYVHVVTAGEIVEFAKSAENAHELAAVGGIEVVFIESDSYCGSAVFICEHRREAKLLGARKHKAFHRANAGNRRESICHSRALAVCRGNLHRLGILEGVRNRFNLRVFARCHIAGCRAFEIVIANVKLRKIGNNKIIYLRFTNGAGKAYACKLTLSAGDNSGFAAVDEKLCLARFAVVEHADACFLAAIAKLNLFLADVPGNASVREREREKLVFFAVEREACHTLVAHLDLSRNAYSVAAVEIAGKRRACREKHVFIARIVFTGNEAYLALCVVFSVERVAVEYVCYIVFVCSLFICFGKHVGNNSRGHGCFACCVLFGEHEHGEMVALALKPGNVYVSAIGKVFCKNCVYSAVGGRHFVARCRPFSSIIGDIFLIVSGENGDVALCKEIYLLLIVKAVSIGVEGNDIIRADVFFVDSRDSNVAVGIDFRAYSHIGAYVVPTACVPRSYKTARKGRCGDKVHIAFFIRY